MIELIREIIMAHEDNIQQEIVESLAKKYIELDKRQSKIEALNLEQLPAQVKDLDKSITEIKEMKMTNFWEQLNKYGSQLKVYGEKLQAIPKYILVRNRIEFDIKSKFVIKIVLWLSLAVAILIAMVVMLLIELSSRSEAKDKYELVRGFYPEVAAQVDSGYLVNRDKLIRQANINITRRQQLLDAEINAQQAVKMSKEAQQKLRHLKKQKK